MHFVIFPVSIIFPTVLPRENSVTIYQVVLNVSFIFIAICPYKRSKTFFLPIFVVAFKLSAIRPFLTAKAFLLITFPDSFEYMSCCFHKFASTVGSPVVKLSLEDISFGRKMLAFTLLVSVFEKTFVFLAVWPYLDTKTVFLLSFQLSCVDRTVIKQFFFNLFESFFLHQVFLQFFSLLLLYPFATFFPSIVTLYNHYFLLLLLQQFLFICFFFSLDQTVALYVYRSRKHFRVRVSDQNLLVRFFVFYLRRAASRSHFYS